MFLEKVFSGKNDIGRWIALIMIVMSGIYLIGLIPLKIVMFFNLNDNPDLVPDLENPLDLSSYDITSAEGLALTLFPFIMGLLALLLLIRPVHERPAVSLFTSNSFRWRRFLWAAVVWLILISIYTIVSVTAGFQKISLQYPAGDFVKLVIISILIIPVKAIFEETFFRGYLMQGFTKLFLNRWMPILATAVLFTILQSLYPEAKAFGLKTLFPYYLLFGVFLAICSAMDDGLELALGIHVISAVFYTVLFTSQSNVIQTPALFNIIDSNIIIEILGLCLISLLFLQLAKKKFSWPQWNYLLLKTEEPSISGEMSDDQQFGFLGEYDDDESD